MISKKWRRWVISFNNSQGLVGAENSRSGPLQAGVVLFWRWWRKDTVNKLFFPKVWRVRHRIDVWSRVTFSVSSSHQSASGDRFTLAHPQSLISVGAAGCNSHVTSLINALVHSQSAEDAAVLVTALSPRKITPASHHHCYLSTELLSPRYPQDTLNSNFTSLSFGKCATRNQTQLLPDVLTRGAWSAD